MNVQVAREIDAPADDVWAAVTDLDAAPRMISAIDAVERLDDGVAFGVGTTWRETRTMFGRSATERLEVTQLDAPRRYTATAVNGATVATSVIAIAPLGADRCRLSMSMATTSANLVGRFVSALVGVVFARSMRTALQRDLDDITAWVARDPTGTA